MENDKTKLDWCFKDKAKEVGYYYYVNEQVTNLSKNNNIYTCNCNKYKTKIELSNNNEIDDMECTCTYYENEDNYCPHLYALICHIYNTVKEESSYNNELLNKYKNMNINKIKKEYENKNIDLIDLDILGYKYEDIFEDLNDELKLDKVIECIPLEVLEKAKLEATKQGMDTAILDKNINNKLSKKNLTLKEKNQNVKRVRNTIFKEFIKGIFNKKSSPKKDNINEYEPYQFEEQELEDDDYYFEDDNEK